MHVVDASHPIIALSCLAPPETLYAPDAAQSISWLHDGHPPTSLNGSEYLVFFITLWHACSLLQPDLFFFDSQFRRLWAHGFTTVTPPAAAWLSHPMHVSVLTSPQAGGDRLDVWLLDAASDVIVARSCPYVPVGCGAQHTGGGGDGSAHILACQLLDTCYYGPASGPSDVGLPLARGTNWRVGYDVDNLNGSTIVAVRIPATDCAPMTDSASVLGCSWQGHALGPGPGMASPDSPDLDVSRSSSESQRHGRSSRSAALEESHEARGVGLIVKALVQQNAGASLFLRTMVCVAALLCFAHAILVLGERPSLFVGCCTSE